MLVVLNEWRENNSDSQAIFDRYRKFANWQRLALAQFPEFHTLIRGKFLIEIVRRVGTLTKLRLGSQIEEFSMIVNEFKEIHEKLRTTLTLQELVANCFFLNDDSVIHTMIWFSRLAKIHRSYMQELTEPTIDTCLSVIEYIYDIIGIRDSRFTELMNVLVSEVPTFAV
jgi:hypothetical protein